MFCSISAPLKGSIVNSGCDHARNHDSAVWPIDKWRIRRFCALSFRPSPRAKSRRLFVADKTQDMGGGRQLKAADNGVGFFHQTVGKHTVQTLADSGAQQSAVGTALTKRRVISAAIVGVFSFSQRLSGLPVMRKTSKARPMRRPSFACKILAVFSSNCINSACIAGKPRFLISSFNAARIGGDAGGKSCNPSRRAL